MGGANADKTIEEGISYQMELVNEFPFKRSERSGHLYGFGEYMQPWKKYLKNKYFLKIYTLI